MGGRRWRASTVVLRELNIEKGIDQRLLQRSNRVSS